MRAGVRRMPSWTTSMPELRAGDARSARRRCCGRRFRAILWRRQKRARTASERCEKSGPRFWAGAPGSLLVSQTNLDCSSWLPVECPYFCGREGNYSKGEKNSPQGGVSPMMYSIVLPENSHIADAPLCHFALGSFQRQRAQVQRVSKVDAILNPYPTQIYALTCLLLIPLPRLSAHLVKEVSSDEALGRVLATMANIFNVSPGFGFYDDSAGYNALASSEAKIQNTWGTVAFGTGLGRTTQTT